MAIVVTSLWKVKMDSDVLREVFANLAVKITKTKRIHSLIDTMGSMNSSTLRNKMDPRARNAPKSVPEKGCHSVHVASNWSAPTSAN